MQTLEEGVRAFITVSEGELFKQFLNANATTNKGVIIKHPSTSLEYGGGLNLSFEAELRMNTKEAFILVEGFDYGVEGSMDLLSFRINDHTFVFKLCDQFLRVETSLDKTVKKVAIEKPFTGLRIAMTLNRMIVTFKDGDITKSFTLRYTIYENTHFRLTGNVHSSYYLHRFIISEGTARTFTDENSFKNPVLLTLPDTEFLEGTPINLELHKVPGSVVRTEDPREMVYSESTRILYTPELPYAFKEFTHKPKVITPLGMRLFTEGDTLRKEIRTPVNLTDSVVHLNSNGINGILLNIKGKTPRFLGSLTITRQGDYIVVSGFKSAKLYREIRFKDTGWFSITRLDKNQLVITTDEESLSLVLNEDLADSKSGDWSFGRASYVVTASKTFRMLKE